jgi:ribose-phosphate pyrophosphokinase
MNNQLKIFSGSSNPDLAEAICKELSVGLGDVYLHRFPSGEPYCQFRENIRGCDVFIVQSVCNPSDQMLMELLVMIDAAKRASAGRITAVTPYLGFLRQDRKTKSRTPISAKLTADLITCAGADRLVGLDFHCEQAQGFFNIPVDHLHAMPVFLEYIKKHSSVYNDCVFLSPDVGGIKRVTTYAEYVGVDFAFITKKRLGDSQVKPQAIVGDVKDKDVIIIDDLTESCSTLIEAANFARGHGAKQAWAFVTHGLLNETGIHRMKNTLLSGLVTTNSVALPAKIPNIIGVLDIAPLFAKAIGCINTDRSVTSLFDVKEF